MKGQKNLEEKLARPLQTLVIYDKDIRSALDGSKKIIIEKDWIDYQLNLAVLCNLTEYQCACINITNIRHCLAEEITEQEYKDRGFNDYQDMIRGMKGYYANFNDKTKVTIVRYDNIKFDGIM